MLYNYILYSIQYCVHVCCIVMKNVFLDLKSLLSTAVMLAKKSTN